MKKLGALLAGVMLTSSVMAAETVDVMQLQCKELLADQTNAQMMIMWIDGYLSHESGNTTMDQEWVTKLSTHMGTFCASNPESTVQDAINALE